MGETMLARVEDNVVGRFTTAGVPSHATILRMRRAITRTCA